MANFPAYKKVEMFKSNSSYGRYAIKTTDVTFKFFWNKKQAIEFVNKYNNSTPEQQEFLAHN